MFKFKKITTIISIVAILSIFLFGIYSYLTPIITIQLIKSTDGDNLSNYEYPVVSVQEKFGLPLPNAIKTNLNTWTIEMTKIMQDITSMQKPFSLKTTIEVFDKKTIVTISGTNTKDNASSDYFKQIEFDFVLTEKFT